LAALFWLASLSTRMQARKHGVRYRYLFMHPSGAELAELAELIDKKRLDVIVDRVFPFEEIGEAVAYLEKGHAKGKVVVKMA
jgi:alcohol dehydrogenase